MDWPDVSNLRSPVVRAMQSRARAIRPDVALCSQKARLFSQRAHSAGLVVGELAESTQVRVSKAFCLLGWAWHGALEALDRSIRFERI